jgi:hypothetical protein
MSAGLMDLLVHHLDQQNYHFAIVNPAFFQNYTVIFGIATVLNHFLNCSIILE